VPLTEKSYPLWLTLFGTPTDDEAVKVVFLLISLFSTRATGPITSEKYFSISFKESALSPVGVDC